MCTDGVVSQRDGDVQWITFNRPHKLNCLTLADLDELARILDETASCEQVRSVIFTGAGDRSFSAGMHVQEFENRTPSEAHALINKLKAVCDRVRRLPQVAIMAINGHCIGGALEIAMAGDLRVASEQARFAMPEINLGIPSVLDSILLQQYVGLSLAKEMLLLGEVFTVDQINHSGFINRVVPLDQVRSTAKEYALAVATKPAATVKQQKALFETWQNTGFDLASADSTNQFALAFTSGVPAERLAAYMQARQARKGR